MKQLSVIFICIILLIQAGGYNLVMRWQQRQAYDQMVNRIDRKEYDEQDLIEISAPLNLPYFTDWQDFERRDGQVTINGVVYNYVARKYVNNVMIYKCIANERHQRIIEAKERIDQLTFNTPATPKNKKAPAIQFRNLGEYDDVNCIYRCEPAFTNAARHLGERRGFQPLARCITPLTPPPDRA